MSTEGIRTGTGSWFGNRGVRTRILTAVGVAGVVATLVGGLGVVALDRTDTSAQSLYAGSMRSLQVASDLGQATVEMRLAVTNQALSADAAELGRFEAAAREREGSIRELLTTYRELPMTTEQLTLLDQYEAALDRYVVVRDGSMLVAGRADDFEAWRAARDAASADIATTVRTLDELVAGELATAAAAAAGVHTTYVDSRRLVIVVLVLGLLLAMALGVLVARSIVGGITRVRAVAEALEQGDLTVTSGLRSVDEVGQMGSALDTAVGNLRQMVATIDASSGSLAGAAEEMSAATTQIASTAEETATQAGVVSAAAEQVSRNVQTVAAGSEQMGASIGEIAQNATRAAEVARRAVDAANETSTTMGRLGESSKEIGNVVKLITTIAEQTNLLALNATIEAARAGEAGKGFAVVAGEVKDLAQETARATEEIARRVEAIQSDTSGAVAAIDEISEIIGSINDFQLTIASAVEEQTATTGEIARNVSEAATGSGEIAANIAGVASAADLTTQGVSESQRAVVSLAQMSGDLKTLVARFAV